MDRLFRSANEKINPIINDLDTLFYWVLINPFETMGWLYTITWLLLSFLIVFIWSLYILKNINSYSNKQTMLKSVLILVFLFITIVVTIYKPWKTNTTPFNMNLVYHFWEYNESDQDKELWYKDISSKSIYRNPFMTSNDFNVKKYLNFNILESFDTENLSIRYRDPNELNNKNYVIWMNWLFSSYGNVWVTNSFLSNWDLYNIKVISEWNENTIPDNTVNKSSFEDFMVYINTNFKEDKYKTNILNEEFTINEPIEYEWDVYEFFNYDNSKKYRTDIILKSIEVDNQNNYKYLLLPYYDLKYILTEWKESGTIVEFMDIWDDNEKSDISQESKLIYSQIYTSLLDLFNDFDSFSVDENSDYVNARVYTSSSNLLFWIDTDKLKYIYLYNKEKNNDELYDTKMIVSNTEKDLNLIVKQLETLKNNHKLVDDYKEKNKWNTSSTYLKELEELESKLNEAQDSIYSNYDNLLSKKINDDIILNVNRLYVNNISSLSPSLNEFKSLWNSGDKYSRIDSQIGRMSLLLSALNEDEIFDLNEKQFIKILQKIDVLDSKNDWEVSNKHGIFEFTILNIVKIKNDYSFSQEIDEKIVWMICNDEKELTSVINRYNSLYNLNINSSIINCSLNESQIINPEALKESLNKLILLYSKDDLKEKINLIPYFALLKDDSSKNENIFTSSFSNNTSNSAFMTDVINIWELKFISPLIYYNYLLKEEPHNIPWFFVNLIPIEWKVYDEIGTYDLKLWSKNSWYKELDSVNGEKYTTTLNFWPVPVVHNIFLAVFWFLNQLLSVWIFLVIFSTFIILLKNR